MAQKKSPEEIPPQSPVKIGYFSNALALYCVDFPIFCIESISERHIVIAGGGGSANTGVPNEIHVLELIPTSNSCAALVSKYKIPNELPFAVMAGSLMKDSSSIDTRFVSCGGKDLVIYNLSFELAHRNYIVSDYKILKNPIVQDDIKRVRYIPGGRVLTGGFDGQLTVWNINMANKDTMIETSFKAHAKSIDEIDVNPVVGQIITLSRDENRMVVWDLKNYKVVKEFKRDIINDKSQFQNANISYKYKSCRYAYDTTDIGSNDSCLLVACDSHKVPSLLYKWASRDKEFKKIACQTVITDGISAMEVSKDGKHFAIGTSSGGVAVFDVKTLRGVYKLDNAHNNSITNLEFLPPKQESLTLTNAQLCPLLSVSIDRRVILHRPRRGSIVFRTLKWLLMAIILILAFTLMQNYYLQESPTTIVENRTSMEKNLTELLN